MKVMQDKVNYAVVTFQDLKIGDTFRYASDADLCIKVVEYGTSKMGYITLAEGNVWFSPDPTQRVYPVIYIAVKEELRSW
jgi:hypothetical protein